MGKIYFYMRISTQEEHGKQKYTRQESALQKYATAHSVVMTPHNTFRDDCSGKSFDRPEWKELESDVRSGDTIVFKDLSRFTREAENGYAEYQKLMNGGVNLVFLDNTTVSTDYIKDMLHIAEEQNIVVKTSLESIVKLLLIVELDRAEQERLAISKRIRDGIAASNKKSGRKQGSTIKLSDSLRKDIQKYLTDRSVKGIDLMRKYHISRNTFNKYALRIKDEMKK